MLNDMIARSEEELDVFQVRGVEMGVAIFNMYKLSYGHVTGESRGWT